MNLRNVIKNTGAVTASTLLSQAMAAIVVILLARYLNPEGLGLYTTAYAFVNIFSYFNELGLSQLMVQDGSRDAAKLPVCFGNALLVKGVAVGIVFMVMMLCMALMGYSDIQCYLIVIVGIGMMFNNVNQTMYNYFQAREKMAVMAGYQFLQALLIALLTLVVIYGLHLNVVAVTVTHLITYALLTILLVLALRKLVRPAPDRSALPDMIARGLPFGIQRAVSQIFPNLSIFVLSLSFLMVSEAEIGIFGAARSLVFPLIFLPNSFAVSIYPILFRLGAGDRLRHQAAMEKVFKILAAVGIPVSFFLCVLSPEIIGWLYGDHYAGTAAVFAVLCWYFALECLNYPLGDVMLTMNRQWQRTVFQGIALVLLVLLTLWAQPRYGLVGSAWAVLIVEACLFLSYYIFIRLKMYPIRIWRPLLPVLGASLAMLGVAYGIKSWHPLLAAGVAGGVYVLVLLALDKELRGLLKRGVRGA